MNAGNNLKVIQEKGRTQVWIDGNEIACTRVEFSARAGEIPTAIVEFVTNKTEINTEE